MKSTRDMASGRSASNSVPYIVVQSLRITAAAVALVLLAASCGDSSDGAEPTTAAPAASTAAPTTAVAVTSTSSAPGPTPAPPTTAPPTTAAATTAPPTTLAGQETDFGPRAGDVLAVVGVEHDDVLNVRSGPGVANGIVTTLDPLAVGIVAGGNNRLLTSSIWFGVTANGITAWASGSFLGYIGGSEDATASVVADLGSLPEAATMTDLGAIVAQTMVATEPVSRVTVADIAASDQVTIDILDIGDDSLFGYRLVVMGTPTADGWSLFSVQRTFLCSRGLSGSLCT